jgi:hypothetical protein
MPFVKYPQENKEMFFKCLQAYKNSIQNGDACAIVLTGLRLRRACENVPKSYERYVRQAYRALNLKIQR